MAASTRPEQVILFEVEAWAVNCPRHIPRKINAAIDAENADLRRQLERMSS